MLNLLRLRIRKFPPVIGPSDIGGGNDSLPLARRAEFAKSFGRPRENILQTPSHAFAAELASLVLGEWFGSFGGLIAAPPAIAHLADKRALAGGLRARLASGARDALLGTRAADACHLECSSSHVVPASPARLRTRPRSSSPQPRSHEAPCLLANPNKGESQARVTPLTQKYTTVGFGSPQSAQRSPKRSC